MNQHQLQETAFSAKFSDEIAVKLTALANAGGGVLLIGIKDNGKVVGIIPAETEESVRFINEKKCFPSLVLTTKVVQIDMKLVLEITIAAPLEKPVFAIDVTRTKIAYYRGENNLFQLSKIIVGLWNLQKKQGPVTAITEDLDFVQQALLALFEPDKHLTLSQLYKLLSVEKSVIDKSLIQLIYRGHVGYQMGETMRYFLQTESGNNF